jgi:exodeoxyribonuclease V gamma subunit
VSEFLDAIERGFPVEEDLNKENRLVVKHRLQAFSCDYFNGKSALSSFSAENCATQLEKRTNPWQPAEFISTPIAPPTEEWRDISLAKLLRFFDNPSRYLLENRLGIRLEDVAVPLEEREPFAFVGLEAYGLKQELLEISLQGGDVGSFLPVARCRGILPPARHGEELFAAAAEEVTEFAATVREKLGGKPPLSPLDFELDLGGFRLTGRLDRIWQDRLIRYRCTKMKAKDRVRAWLEHLVLNAVNQEGYPRETLLLMTDSSIMYGPVENAAAILQTILDLYWDGLTVPLRFFPASSMEYAKKQEWKLERARTRWEQGYNYPGEGDDPYFKLCFGKVDPFNADFERVSRALLEPLLQHQV